MAKGGGFFENVVAAGVGAYAAKQSSSVRGLGYNLLIVFAILFAVGVVARVLMSLREGFVPTFPSSSGDKKDVTPAGNVILY